MEKQRYREEESNFKELFRERKCTSHLSLERNTWRVLYNVALAKNKAIAEQIPGIKTHQEQFPTHYVQSTVIK